MFRLVSANVGTQPSINPRLPDCVVFLFGTCAIGGLLHFMHSVRTIKSGQMSRSFSCSRREVTIQTFSPVVRAIKLTHYRTRSLVF